MRSKGGGEARVVKVRQRRKKEIPGVGGREGLFTFVVKARGSRGGRRRSKGGGEGKGCLGLR